jgi:hypothetical protein
MVDHAAGLVQLEDRSKLTMQKESDGIKVKKRNSLANYWVKVISRIPKTAFAASVNNVDVPAYLISSFMFLIKKDFHINSWLKTAKFYGFSFDQRVRFQCSSGSSHTEHPTESSTSKTSRMVRIAPFSSESSTATTDLLSNSKHKKRIRDLDDPDEPEENVGGKKVRPSVRLANRKLFACHFQKRNPQRFHPSVDSMFSGCVGSSIPQLRRIEYVTPPFSSVF